MLMEILSRLGKGTTNVEVFNLWSFYFCSMTWGETICSFYCYWPITVEMFSSFSTKRIDDIMLYRRSCSFTSISKQHMLMEILSRLGKGTTNVEVFSFLMYEFILRWGYTMYMYVDLVYYPNIFMGQKLV
jgi:hypothetical protein